MKKLVVCSKDLDKVYDHVLQYEVISANGKEYHFAIVESDTRLPDKLGENDVLIQKSAFSCNFRDFYFINKVTEINVNDPEKMIFFPLGSEFCAKVVKVGKDVTRLKKDDRVIVNASYPFTDYTDLPGGIANNNASNEYEILHHGKLTIIPDSMPDAVAASFTIGAQTTFGMLRRLEVKENSNVLITGVNSNTSLFAANTLKHLNVNVYGLSRSKIDPSLISSLGLNKVFITNDKMMSYLECKEAKHFIDQGKAFDYVIDPFSDSNLIKVLDLMSLNSKYITCGISNQTASIEQNISLNNTMAKIIHKNIAVMGNCLGSGDDLQSALNSYAAGKMDVELYKVTSDLREFIFDTFFNKDRIGKVVFEYHND